MDIFRSHVRYWRWQFRFTRIRILVATSAAILWLLFADWTVSERGPQSHLKRAGQDPWRGGVREPGEYHGSGSLQDAEGQMRSRSPGSLCRSVDYLHISSVFYPEEDRSNATPVSGPAGGGCGMPHVPTSELVSCLTSRRRRLGRATRLLFLGDSRVRMLFTRLAAELNISVPYILVTRSETLWARLEAASTPASYFCWLESKWCPRQAASQLVHLQFVFQPYLNQEATERIQRLVVQCTPPERDLCPDLVITNGHLWYLQGLQITGPVYPDYNSFRTQWSTATPLFLRHRLDAAAPALLQLSQLTRVLWRLDEGVPVDFDRHFWLDQEPGPVLHAILYEFQLKQVPGLVLWSSFLPLSQSFLRGRCRRLYSRRNSWSAEDNQYFQSECGDYHHGGSTAKRRALDFLYPSLCLAN